MNSLTILDGGTGRELAELARPLSTGMVSLVADRSAAFRLSGPPIVCGRRGRCDYDDSYALVSFHLGEARFDAQGESLAALAGQLAYDVSRQSARVVAVAGSLPPTCGSYRPTVQQGRGPPYSRSAGQGAESVCRPLAGGNPERPGRSRNWCVKWWATTASHYGSRSPCRTTSLRQRAPACAPANRSTMPLAWPSSWARTALLFNCSQPEVMAAAIEAAAQVVRSTGAALRMASMPMHFRRSPRTQKPIPASMTSGPI